ncbi:MAG: hypothetical protein JWR73_2129 [Tardiphaga sp.]|nr:hypothetical protein [Tardiphaga sp.]
MSIEYRRSLLRTSAMACTLAIGVLVAPAFAAPAPAPESISVNVDQAKLVKLPERIATIVVGNPLIADVSLQPGGLVVVTGKGYGATNVIAMDRRGEVLLDRVIYVEGPSDKVVTIYRGVDRESYSCMPVCQRRVTLGDKDAFFKSTMDQGGVLNEKASGVVSKDNK